MALDLLTRWPWLKHCAYAACLLISVASLHFSQVETTTRVRATLLAGCARGNKLREVLSGNETAFKLFLADAIEVRSAAAKNFAVTGDKVQAKLNADVADKYRGQIILLRSVPVIDCEQAFPK